MYLLTYLQLMYIF